MKRKKRFQRIREILHSFDVIYREINEYNTTYWSKFLASVWIFFGSIVIFLNYIAVFSVLPIETKILISYAEFNVIILLHLIISITCSLNAELNKTHKISYTKILELNKNKQIQRIHKTFLLLKVTSFFYFRIFQNHL